jgi:hypothetical protein
VATVGGTAQVLDASAPGAQVRAFSPDGKRLTYWVSSGNYGLSTVAIGGGQATRLTTRFTAAFLPDSRLVFLSSSGDLQVATADMTGFVTLASASQDTYSSFDVSHDGTVVLFVDPAGNLATVPVSGGAVQLLASGLASLSSPSFSPTLSPDGARAIFQLGSVLQSVSLGTKLVTPLWDLGDYVYSSTFVGWVDSTTPLVYRDYYPSNAPYSYEAGTFRLNLP